VSRVQIVIVAGALMALAFVLAANIYSGQREDAIRAVSEAEGSRLERAYSVSQGPDDARVVLVEFFDPACETCREFHSYVKKLVAAHPGKVRLVLRYSPFHQGADTMVLILEAARRQGRFWETLEVMYATQPQWASHHQPRPERIWEFLPSAGVDVEQIRKDMRDPDLMAIVHQDLADGRALGVRKTPQFFVNGKPLLRFGRAQLKTLLDSEVAARY
jgi:protein-disulfide isomerase